MRLRFWIGLAAVLLIAAGSVVAALLVYNDDQGDFRAMQRDEAIRAAHQTEAVAGFSIGQLASASAFFKADGDLNSHEFDVVSGSLLGQGILRATAFIKHVPQGERRRYERRRGVEILERQPNGHLGRAGQRSAYYPLTFVAAPRGASRTLGFDVGSDPERAPFLMQARDTGKPIATPVVPLVLGGRGVIVYRAVYRDGAPTGTVAQRRRALLGFVAGSFLISRLDDPADAALADDVDFQLQVSGNATLGAVGDLDEAAAVPVDFANRTWLLVVSDPNRPDISLPLLLAVIGISLASLLAALIVTWSRNERMQRLEQEAGHDALTGLKNRRRFEEELRTAMARGRREGTTGALLMLDLDNFKHVNDTYGHPAGDQLIQEVAGVLRRRSRESDTLARLGGDEFAVVLPRCSPEEARLVAESIAGSIRVHRPEQDAVEPVTASVGVAMFGDDPRVSYASLVSEADTAMYAAKDSGRDGVVVFDASAIRKELLDTE